MMEPLDEFEELDLTEPSGESSISLTPRDDYGLDIYIGEQHVNGYCTGVHLSKDQLEELVEYFERLKRARGSQG
jgi:hypothetical protein